MVTWDLEIGVRLKYKESIIFGPSLFTELLRVCNNTLPENFRTQLTTNESRKSETSKVDRDPPVISTSTELNV